MRARRCLAVLSTVAAATLGGVSAATAAESPASLTIHSEPGDPIGQGLDYSYVRPRDQIRATGSTFGDPTIHTSANGANGESWLVDFDPPEGERLGVGVYEDAERSPFQSPGHPGVMVAGLGFSCDMTGRFTIHELTYGVDGVLSSFRATFEQRCDGATGTLTGEVIWTPAPPQPPLELTLTIDPKGTVDSDGHILIVGSVTCTQSDFVSVGISATQRRTTGEAFGGGSQGVECHPGASYRWTILASPNDVPFRVGRVMVSGDAHAVDANTGEIVTTTTSASVHLVPQRTS
jgi:hypothetical protein